MVRKLGVFRGLYLGDLVAATGALRALRRGYPEAEISLISLPWAVALSPHLPHVNRILPYPGTPGLDGGGDEASLEKFVARMRDERFGLAMNMHGRGPTSTRLVIRFGARRTASFVGDEGDIRALDVGVPWDAEAHESRKLLLLAEKAVGSPTGALGSPEPELHVREEDNWRARALVPPAKKHLAIVHPGASVAEKRWPAQAFGRVAEALVCQGYAVAVTGSMGERKLTRCISGLAPGTMDLGGQTDLSTLIALVARASVLISNDTGPAHLAYALQTPSVTIFGPSTDVERWGPLNRRRHAVLFGNPISNVSTDNALRSIQALAMSQERLGA
ncbi:MAG: glycosyltransferase family 9 protein [Rubrobacter sp.]|nr:glycosyltransferase family 9 protein [Rubrobacter sp.]